MIKRTVKPEPGIYYGVPEEEYFSWECFSKSMIPATLRSARHLKAYLEGEKTSDPMRLGSLVDALLLEPKALEKYCVLSDTYINSKGEEKPWNANSKDCKAEMEAIINENKIPVKSKFMEQADIIKLAVLQHDIAARIINGSQKQVAMVWVDEDTGILCKGRIDCLLPESIADLKTTQNAYETQFSRDMFNFGYHQQAAFYKDGYAALNKGKFMPFHIIAAETSEPYGVAVYEVCEDSIEAGQHSYKIALNRYSEYLKEDPELTQGYPQTIQPIDIPAWAFKKFDESLLGDTE